MYYHRFDPGTQARYVAMIAQRGSLYVEHVAGHPRLRLSVYAPPDDVEDLTALRDSFKMGHVTKRRWSTVAAHAREVVAWTRSRLGHAHPEHAARFEERIASLQLIYPDAIVGGRRSRKPRDTYHQ